MSEDEYKTCVIDNKVVEYLPIADQPEQLAIGQIWEHTWPPYILIEIAQKQGEVWKDTTRFPITPEIITSLDYRCIGIAVEEVNIEKEATEMKVEEYKGTQLTDKIGPTTTLEVGQKWKGVYSGNVYKVYKVYQDYGEAVCDLVDQSGKVSTYNPFSSIKENCTYLGLAAIEVETPPTSPDMVSMPPHYLLFPEHELEAKHIVKRVMDNADEKDFDMSSHEASWLVQSILYMLRFYGKNGWEDIKKAQETLGIAIDSYEERMHNTEAD